MADGEDEKLDLAEILAVLHDFGDVNLCGSHKTDLSSLDGWRATIKLKTRHTGADFDIRSELNHSTAQGAAEQLLHRVWACVGKTIMGKC